jgi:hypothetical protein
VAIYKYKFTLNIGFAGENREEIMEYDSDDFASLEEMDRAAQEDWSEWIWNYIDGAPARLTDGEDE